MISGYSGVYESDLWTLDPSSAVWMTLSPELLPYASSALGWMSLRGYGTSTEGKIMDTPKTNSLSYTPVWIQLQFVFLTNWSALVNNTVEFLSQAGAPATRFSFMFPLLPYSPNPVLTSIAVMGGLLPNARDTYLVWDSSVNSWENVSTTHGFPVLQYIPISAHAGGSYEVYAVDVMGLPSGS